MKKYQLTSIDRQAFGSFAIDSDIFEVCHDVLLGLAWLKEAIELQQVFSLIFVNGKEEEGKRQGSRWLNSVLTCTL